MADAAAAAEAAGALTIKEKGAVKFVQSLSGYLVSGGLVLNGLGVSTAFRADSGFTPGAQYNFLLCAVWYFLLSVTTAGISNAIEDRLAWLEWSYVLAWLESSYLIAYSSVLTYLVAHGGKSSPESDLDLWYWYTPVITVFFVSCVWCKLFGLPRFFMSMFFTPFHMATGGIAPWLYERPARRQD